MLQESHERAGLSPAAHRVLQDVHLFVDGRREGGRGSVARKLDPATGALLGQYTTADPEQVERAVRAARRAHDQGVWGRESPLARSQRLHRLVELMEQRRDVLLELVVADVGTPVSFAAPVQLNAAVENFRWFAEAARTGPDGWYESALPPDLPHDGIASAGLLVREPVGVVAALTAYNFPYILAAWKLAGALAAGCPVVLLPSPRASLATAALFALIEELDLPPGVCSLLLGGPAVGQQLTSSAEVDLVTFTGSVATGTRVMAQAAPRAKRLVLELGGKSAAVLLPGADLDTAVPTTLLRLITNSGQRCGATSRIIVHEDEAEAFSQRARAFLADVRVDDPLDPETVVGPLVDEEHLHFVQGHVSRALGDGAELLAGGPAGHAPAAGWFMRPVLLGGLDNAHPFCQEEQFGPVGSVLTYRAEQEAVDLANGSDFGLNAAVFGPTTAALGVARRIRSGTVSINGGGRLRPSAPWGGYGLSGIGREGGHEGFREFFEVKHIQWPIR